MYTGTASGGHCEPMESPFTLLRSSEASLVRDSGNKVDVHSAFQSGCWLDRVAHHRGQSQRRQMNPFLLPGRTGLL